MNTPDEYALFMCPEGKWAKGQCAKDEAGAAKAEAKGEAKAEAEAEAKKDSEPAHKVIRSFEIENYIRKEASFWWGKGAASDWIKEIKEHCKKIRTATKVVDRYMFGLELFRGQNTIMENQNAMLKVMESTTHHMNMFANDMGDLKAR